MPTFINALLNSVGDRWREVDVLLDQAMSEEGKTNLEFHDVLCRASVVLIAAHLEGYIRDCAKAIIEDVNRFSSFKNSPTTFKRTFCSSFLVAEDENSNLRVEKLIQTFDDLATKLTHEPFLFDGKNDDHKNASPTVIDKIVKNRSKKSRTCLPCQE
ncbi:hypothetical protein BH11PLA2_BH11PLA2_10930 [soil metagenome]